jgi:hypothetical protein
MTFADLTARRIYSVIFFCILFIAVGCGGGGKATAPSPLAVPSPTPAGGLLVAPSRATVALGLRQPFSATTNGSPSMVNWSVNGVAGGNNSVGTINTDGSYLAPANFPSPNTITVTATSQTDPTQTTNATVTVVYPNDNHTMETLPIHLGTSGGNSNDSATNGTTITCCSGTLGSLLALGGNLFILSNNHVLDKSGQGTTGDPVTQPGLVDNFCKPGTVVAKLSQAAALKPTNGANGPSPSNVDAAIAEVIPGTVDPGGAILDLGAANSTGIAAAPPSATLASPTNVLANNEGVAKSGRSTGLTCSTLQSINTNISVQYDGSCGGTVAFTAIYSNQLLIAGGNFSASGDSGSLIVTSDTARPVGLLFAGNGSSTSANPIQDVIKVFTSGGNVPAVVGGGDHPVSCQPTGAVSAIAATPASASAMLSAAEFTRATAAKEKYAQLLMSNPVIYDVGVTASADNPREGAVSVTVSGETRVPVQLDGVRTRVIYANSPAPRATAADIARAATIKESQAQGLMAQSGIQGVGAGVSDDNPSESALVIYVVAGTPHPEIPPTVGGLRTKVIEGDRFRAFGWGKETVRGACRKK